AARRGRRPDLSARRDRPAVRRERGAALLAPRRRAARPRRGDVDDAAEPDGRGLRPPGGAGEPRALRDRRADAGQARRRGVGVLGRDGRVPSRRGALRRAALRDAEGSLVSSWGQRCVSAEDRKAPDDRRKKRVAGGWAGRHLAANNPAFAWKPSPPTTPASPPPSAS